MAATGQCPCRDQEHALRRVFWGRTDITAAENKLHAKLLVDDHDFVARVGLESRQSQ